MNESMSVGAAKHWATSVSYVEPILGMKSCTSASILTIVISVKNSIFQANRGVLVMKRRERSVKLVLDEKQSRLMFRKLK